MRYSLALLLICTSLLVACGGGGGGGSAVPFATPTPTPIPTAAPVSIPVGVTPANASLGSVSGQSGNLGLPAAASGSGIVTAQLVAGQPSGTPTLQSSARLPHAIGSSQLTPIVFVAFTPSATLSFAQTPSFAFSFPAGFGLASGSQAYIAIYDPTQAPAGWQSFAGPGVVSGAPATGITISFAAVARSVTFAANQTYIFALFATAATINPAPTPTPTPSPQPTATATSVPTNVAEAGFACPTDDQIGSVGRVDGRASSDAVHRRATSHGTGTAASRLAVTYDRSAALSNRRGIAANESGLGATLVQTYDLANANTTIRVIAVPPGQLASAMTLLRAQSGVRSVEQTGGHRYTSTVTQPYFPNDPYFNGFTSTQNSAANNPAPTTFQVGPYEESAVVPGQWDMHAIGVENAFAYSQTGNGSGVLNASALGSPAIKIAIIDTGEDSTHPELSGGKVVLKRCFITGPNNFVSTSNFSTDPLGHGTDVSGIAAGSIGNGLGFVGVGGNVSIMAYRVFPTPDDSCASDNSSSSRCGADTADIASAIEDAITNGANVISMSLGGGGCINGSDEDPLERAAVADAIARNVIVVVASGNEFAHALDAPACDTGVIAVGATSLDDGQPIGTTRTGHGTALSPVEYVASYSNFSSPGSNLRNPAAWGIVAPGGDPNGNLDNDDLHWIEHIWTSTPFMSSPSDTAFTGTCADDYPNSSLIAPPVNCRVQIAGTSMATPHVAGAAALILSVSHSYQSATAMKQLLCQTADDIGDHQGCGRLNVYRAMATALGDSHLP